MCLQQILNVERWQAEELVGSLRLKLQKRALDGAHGGCRYVAVLRGVFLGVLRDPVEHGAQVFQVVNEQATIVGYAEYNVQHAVLRLVELHQTRQQLWSHLRHGGTHGVSLLAIDVKETYGTGLELWVLDAELWQTFLDESAHLAHL